MKLKDIGEFGFIRRISSQGLIRPEGVVKGIGDDCAVIDLDGSRYLLVTTDLLVEGVHFIREWATPEMLGSKALAVNLSDIAACGGNPRDAFISLAIPEHIDVEWLDSFYDGMSGLARNHQVNLLGGDTTNSKTDLVINLTVTGIVPREELLLRNTAMEGDIIAITGRTGASAAGCSILVNCSDFPPHIAQPLIKSHLNPRPHTREGRFLAESHACTAAIDVSDGLSSDLTHICQESGLGALIYEKDIPIQDALIQAASRLDLNPLDWVLHGGEDYVLLVTLKPERVEWIIEKAAENSLEIITIGNLVRGEKIRLVKSNGEVEDVDPKGWDHFR